MRIFCYRNKIHLELYQRYSFGNSSDQKILQSAGLPWKIEEYSWARDSTSGITEGLKLIRIACTNPLMTEAYPSESAFESSVSK